MAWTYETEFPDFDAPDDCAALAARGWLDQSWHNDTCPNFTIGGKAALFLDYAAPELREAPETVERFTVYPIGPDGYESAGARHFSDLESAATYGESLALARAFANTLQSWLTPEQWGEVRRRNALPEYSAIGACASHDFCDANAAMLESLESIRPGACDGEELPIALFNAAWSIARPNYLTA